LIDVPGADVELLGDVHFGPERSLFHGLLDLALAYYHQGGLAVIDDLAEFLAAITITSLVSD
jgi:hypothetical protein